MSIRAIILMLLIFYTTLSIAHVWAIYRLAEIINSPACEWAMAAADAMKRREK